MEINKMRDYSLTYTKILDELRHLRYGEMVNYLEANPPKESRHTNTFAGRRPLIQPRIELLNLVEALITAKKETGTHQVTLHTLQSVLSDTKDEEGNVVLDKKDLKNLAFLLKKDEGSWFKEVKK
jgi:hypothetical protein